MVLKLSDEIYRAACALGLTLIAWTIYGIVFHPLRHVPGPFYTRVTDIPLKIAVASGHRTTFIHRMHERYGKTVR